MNKKVAVLFTLLVTIVISCMKYPEPPNGGNKIVLGNTTTSDISYTSVTIHSEIKNVSGQNLISQHGHCWSTQPNPDISNMHTSLGVFNSGNSFNSLLKGLQPNTFYFVKPYIIISYMPVYGSEISFKTNAIGYPSVITSEATDISYNSAKSGGIVTSDGGDSIRARGVCWSTSQNPTINDNYTNDGNGTGSFISIANGLSASTHYFLRAYATNSLGIAYGNEVTFTTTSFNCGTSILINHVTGFVAPVDKKVTYGTIMGIPGEPTKCWITSNLGASHQGTAVNDATEASAGWYWQFNRKQGYKHDGTNRTPNTTWIANIDETSDWLLANDPCNLELGKPWHVPTYTEWHNVFNGSGWVNWNELWNSGLKLHAAGVLYYDNGSLGDRGSYGYYWSSTQSSSTHGYSVHFGSSGIATDYGGIKPAGFTIRCLSGDCSLPLSPSEGTHNSSLTTIIWKWNNVPGATGYKWSTSNDYATATDMGPLLTKTETGLTCNTNYSRYVWAYNICGNSVHLTINATTSPCTFTCGQTIVVNHVAGGVAPVNKTVNYGTVTNIPGETTKCWITKNLGATQQATTVSDATEASAGWYWQFNRKQGYKHEGTTLTPGWTITSISENSDWLTANDPCTIELGTPWRLPTYTEWYNVDNTGGWTNWNGPWNSGLKLHAAGRLYTSSGSLGSRGANGKYWSSTQGGATNSWHLDFGIGGSSVYGYDKACGFSARCLRD